jgi:hypothetical protein
MNKQERYDPFGDEDLREEIAAFKPKQAGQEKPRPHEVEVEQIAQARGFDNRAPIPHKPAKEPLKPLQFRLPESEVNAFRQRAFEEFGPGQGAIVSLFRKIWNDYRDSNA